MRARAEWLLLPLFLLPLLAAGALAAWAAASHERWIGQWRKTAPDRARAWLAAPEGRAAWMGERVARAFLPGGPGTLPAQVFTEAGSGEDVVRLHWVFPPDAPTPGPGTWRGHLAAPLAGTFGPVRRQLSPFRLAFMPSAAPPRSRVLPPGGRRPRRGETTPADSLPRRDPIRRQFEPPLQELFPASP